jgi:hypothetical protein
MSYNVLHQDEKDAFVLIAAMWGYDPLWWSDMSPRREESLVCNLAAVISGREGVAEARSYARSVLKELENRLLKLGAGAEGQRRVIVHDLLIDIAVSVTQSPEVHTPTRFCRWVGTPYELEDIGVPLQQSAHQVAHVAIAGSAPFQLPSTFFADNKVVSHMVVENFVGFSSSWFSTFKRTQGFNQCRLLVLYGCSDVRSLPRSIGQQAVLTVLRLIWCEELKGLPESICQLKCLQVLVLISCSRLKSLPKSIVRLTSLTELNLRLCCSLKGPPESVGHLRHLTKLDLSKCSRLERLPESLSQLVGLTKLDISHCRLLKKLPESFGQLASLTKLDLTQCSALEVLPGSFGQLASLAELGMEG